MKKHWKTVSALVAAVLVVSGVTLTVSAGGPRGWFGGEEGTAPPEGWGRGFMPRQGMPGRPSMPGMRGGIALDWDALAKQLGYADAEALQEALKAGDEDVIAAVQAAHKQAMVDALDQALADEKITPEQYAAMIERLESAEPPMSRGARPMFPGGLDMRGEIGGVLEAAVGKLDAVDTVEELVALLKENDPDDVAAVQEAASEAIAAAVEAGQLPQEQADWLIQGLVSGYLGKGGMMGRGGRCGPKTFGGHRSFGGMRGGFDGQRNGGSGTVPNRGPARAQGSSA